MIPWQGNIKVYRPYKKELTESCFNDYVSGKYPIMYLEMSAACSGCRCLYCDSKVGKASKEELKLDETEKLIEEFNKIGGRILFICGLGEPFEDEKLFPIFDLLKKLEIQVSIFTNGLFIDEKKIFQLNKFDNINLILKLDSFNNQIYDKLLGRKGASTKIYNILEKIIDIGFIHGFDDDYTNFALSTVLTKYNYDHITEIVEKCKKHNIFPILGELENSYMAKRNFKRLKLNTQELVSLRENVENTLGHVYDRPVCPMILTGIHINNIGDCVIDENSGLPCAWFMLEEPNYTSIGNIRDNPLINLANKLDEIRVRHFSKFKNIIEKHNYIFDGGGGIIENWINKYEEIIKCLKERFN